MNQILRTMVAEVKAESVYRPNPGEAPAAVLLLQEKIFESGSTFSEDDLFEACESLGLDGDGAVEFIEQLASWY